MTKSLIFIISLFTLTAQCEERRTNATSIVKADENGLPIIQVILHSKDKEHTSRVFRFIFDTGSFTTILDQSVPQQYFWNDPQIDTNLHDDSGAKSRKPTIIIKRIEIAGIQRDEVPAIRLDLKNGMMGRVQDEPVDGILGMTFLKGLKFVLNSKDGYIKWMGDYFKSGTTAAIQYGADGRPYVPIKVGSEDILSLIDTGNSGGLDLPARIATDQLKQNGLTQGLLGKMNSTNVGVISKVWLGKGFWSDLDVSFAEGLNSGVIGQEILCSSPVYIDFIQNIITFTLDENGKLPYRKTYPPRQPVGWELLSGARALTVLAVKPGSLMETIGLKAGDQIQQFGPLKGVSLTRRSFQEQVAVGNVSSCVVLRQGVSIVLK